MPREAVSASRSLCRLDLSELSCIPANEYDKIAGAPPDVEYRKPQHSITNLLARIRTGTPPGYGALHDRGMMGRVIRHNIDGAHRKLRAGICGVVRHARVDVAFESHRKRSR